MSNVEALFRQNLANGKYFRDPNLTHQEFMDSIRPFMGNPFFAPGTMGAKSLASKSKKVETASQLQVETLSQVTEESNFIEDAQEHKLNV